MVGCFRQYLGVISGMPNVEEVRNQWFQDRPDACKINLPSQRTGGKRDCLTTALLFSLWRLK